MVPMPTFAPLLSCPGSDVGHHLTVAVANATCVASAWGYMRDLEADI